MMTDDDMDGIYKQNIGTSHAAALRGVFDAGYQIGLSQQGGAQTPDASMTTSAALAEADTPVITEP